MKTYLIAGASRGLGKFLAESYSRLGNKVICISKNKKITNKKSFNYKVDLSQYSKTIKFFRKLEKKFKKIDYLISCVGKSNFKSREVNFKEWQEAFNDNLFSNVNLINSYIKIFKKKSANSKIILISSIAGSKIIDAPISYSTSKAALNYYCKHQAKILSKSKIKINAISPGNILLKGNVWDKKIKKNKIETLSYIKKNVPLNGFCKPEYIKDMCDYLLSSSGDFITGSNFTIDGGQVLNG